MMTPRIALKWHLLVLLVFTLSPSPSRGEANWPRWRGPQGNGHSDETNLPVKWDASAVRWRVELDGVGQSSPIVWGDRLFVTSAKASDDDRVERSVHCLNRKDGTILWTRLASTGSAEAIHRMNSWATPSCAVDGERVVAYFGQGGIHCYNFAGKKLWSHDLGQFPGTWGTAASPVIVDEMVIQNCDAQGKSYLIAYDRQTGKQIWRTARQDSPRGGWSTPIVINIGRRRELILNGEYGVQSYDPANGKELWFCQGFNGRGSPTPVLGKGLLYVINGKPGDVYSVRPGGLGDVTKTHMAWHTRRGGGRDLPSPIYVDGFLFTVNMAGIATCYDSATGRELWKQRLGGRFSGSPIAAKGLIYLQDEAGDVVVIRPGNKLDIVATNRLGVKDEIFRASLAPVGGAMFCRSNRAVYCLGK